MKRYKSDKEDKGTVILKINPYRRFKISYAKIVYNYISA